MDINEIIYRIRDEQKAVRDYTHLLSITKNGADRRSILHILNEEKDHEVILQKMLNKYR